MKGILALDQGTTASKAAVYDLEGRLLGLSRVTVRTRFGPGGVAEQDPHDLQATQHLAIRRAMRAAGLRGRDLVAAGIASQRSTFVLWERSTGRPIGPAPTWQSTVAEAACRALAAHEGRVLRITGLPLSPHYSASKIAAILDGGRSLRRRAARGEILFGSVATYLIWRLTRGSVHATDPTQAARTLLFNLRTLDWDEPLLDLFGVPRAMLPEVRDSLGDYGTLVLDGCEVPVRAMLGDQQAALIGALGGFGGAGRRCALVNYGTGAFVLMPTTARPACGGGLLVSLAWTRGARRCHLLEGTINAAGATLDWLRRELGAPEDLARIDALCRRSPGTTLLLPSFWGLGSAFPPPRPAALPPVAMDMPATGSVADLARAAVEAIAHMTAASLRLMESRCVAPPRRIVATGGLARLRYLVEFQSALVGRPVQLALGSEATLAGTALACRPDLGLRLLRRPRCRKIDAPRGLRPIALRRHALWLRLLETSRRWAAESPP